MILDNINYSNTSRYLPSRKDKKYFEQILIHIDFKGAPPKFEFLMDFVKFFGENKIITGFLMEFEDTLPYKGNLECIRADRSSEKCYTESQIKKLVKLIKDLNLKIVPLVQVFSHLEYVLKRNQFKDLREEPEKMLSLCPLKEGSIELVLEIIN